LAEWIQVARLSELAPEGFGHSVKADGLKIALFRWEDRIYAIEDLCPHLGFPLSEGMVQSAEVICGWHGWRIRLEDGVCTRMGDCAKVFPCEVRGDDVYVAVRALPSPGLPSHARSEKV